MSQQAKGRVEINQETCTGCGLCVECCPQKAFTLSLTLNRHGVHPAQNLVGLCTGCGTCRYFCPEPGAIRLYRLDADNREVLFDPAA